MEPLSQLDVSLLPVHKMEEIQQICLSVRCLFKKFFNDTNEIKRKTLNSYLCFKIRSLIFPFSLNRNPIFFKKKKEKKCVFYYWTIIYHSNYWYITNKIPYRYLFLVGNYFVFSMVFDGFWSGSSPPSWPPSFRCPLCPAYNSSTPCRRRPSFPHPRAIGISFATSPPTRSQRSQRCAWESDKESFRGFFNSHSSFIIEATPFTFTPPL